MSALRIAVATAFARKVGGTEHYLDAIIHDLVADHDVALLSDTDGHRERDLIAAAAPIDRWTVSEIGLAPALAALKAWKPDVIYVHALQSPEVEAMLLEVAPNILFPHNYLGTCISGHKTWKTPTPTPCARRLGWGCLLHFYPHRCGGLNPATMIADYRRATRRTALLPRYHTILTTSTHMREEMIKHGAPPSRTFTPPYVALGRSEPRAPVTLPSQPTGATRSTALDRLIFVGRMDILKGGSLLLDAVPDAARRLGRPLHLTMAGDGPERASWERLARARRAGSPSVDVDFVGWVRSGDLHDRFRSADLLVVPSVWPEPFGIVGPQAGSAGVPAAAFDVGGIGEWLTDGANGHLATADPPTAANFAGAIVKCLSDPSHHARLRAGAVELAQRFDLPRHAAALRRILRDVAGTPHQPVGGAHDGSQLVP